MTSTETTYAICCSPLSWHDRFAIDHAKRQPGTRRHRSPQTAAKAISALQASTKRATGMRLDVRLLACEDGEYRELTDAELHVVEDIYIA